MSRIQLTVFIVCSLLVSTSGHCNLIFSQVEPFLNSQQLPIVDETTRSSDVQFSVARGEFEPARILVSVDADWGATTVEVSSMTSASGDTLAADNLEVRIVKRWKQLLDYSYLKKNGPVEHTVDELLVFDDIENLTGKWESARYIPPVASTVFRTNVKKSLTKQLWVTLHVPDDQPAGMYKGAMTLLGRDETAVLPVLVEVLPYQLPEPDKLFGIFYRGSLSDNKRQVDRDTLLAQLVDIKKHGIDALVTDETDLEALTLFADAVVASGMKGPLALSLSQSIVDNEDQLKVILSVITSRGLEPYVYGVDEPNSARQLARQIKFSVRMDEENKILTSLLAETDDTLIRKGVTLDWANLNIQSGLPALRSKASQSGRTITYYWQSYLEDAPRNRYYAGAYLLKTGLDGILPYVYQAFHSIDPYSLDTRVLKGNVRRDKRLYKAFNTTYPASGLPIPTIQWESMREGIDDYRYAQLLLAKAAQSSATDKDRINAALKDQLRQVRYRESERALPGRKFHATSLTEFRNWMKLNINRFSR